MRVESGYIEAGLFGSKIEQLRPYVKNQHVRVQLSGPGQKWWFAVVDRHPIKVENYRVGFRREQDEKGRWSVIYETSRVWKIGVTLYRTEEERNQKRNGRECNRFIVVYPDGTTVRPHRENMYAG